jgi:hypothetical protein
MRLYGLRIEMRKTGGYDEPRIRHKDGKRARRVQRINQKRAMLFTAKIEKLDVGTVEYPRKQAQLGERWLIITAVCVEIRRPRQGL